MFDEETVDGNFEGRLPACGGKGPLVGDFGTGMLIVGAGASFKGFEVVDEEDVADCH